MMIAEAKLTKKNENSVAIDPERAGVADLGNLHCCCCCYCYWVLVLWLTHAPKTAAVDAVDRVFETALNELPVTTTMLKTVDFVGAAVDDDDDDDDYCC